MKTKPRVLLVQPNLQPPGGASAVCAWALQALQDDFQVDALTWTPADLFQVNRFYGTSLDTRKINNFFAPKWLRMLVAFDPDPWSFLRLAWMMRQAKRWRDRYDVVISFCDEIDCGAPCIQYIHYPYLGAWYARWQTSRAARVRIRLRPWVLFADFSFERMRENITLVNSDFTGRQFAAAYQVQPRTLYPPVAGDFPNVDWSARENNFVCMGRLSGEKRYQDIVAILQAVRARGHAVRLHIIGASLGRDVDAAYYQQLRDLVHAERAWVTLHENISHAELQQLVAHQRYGIHAMPQEHFGIAPAEMVRAGCIVFVCNDGGQVEIIGDEPRLRYESNADAVEKISRVLSDENAQAELRAALAKRAALFSTERFMNELRAVVLQVWNARSM